MALEPRIENSPVASMTWRERIRALPSGTKSVGSFFFLLTLVPVVIGVPAVLFGWRVPGSLGAIARHPEAVIALALIAGAVIVAVVEPPRNRSPRGYARQLRERFAGMQAEFDGALRRRAVEEAHHARDPERASPPFP